MTRPTPLPKTLVRLQTALILKRGTEKTGMSNNPPLCRRSKPRTGDYVSYLYSLTGRAGGGMTNHYDGIIFYQAHANKPDWIFQKKKRTELEHAPFCEREMTRNRM